MGKHIRQKRCTAIDCQTNRGVHCTGSNEFDLSYFQIIRLVMAPMLKSLRKFVNGC